MTLPPTISQRLRRLLEGRAKDGGGRVTPERLQRIFNFGLQTGIESIGNPGAHPSRELAFGLGIQPLPQDIDLRRAAKPYRRDEIHHYPAHLKFSHMPRFAYVALVDGGIRYHYGTDGESTLRTCPVTHDPRQIGMIDEVFDYWERDVTSSAAPLSPTDRRPPADRTDPMLLIRQYIERGDTHYLHDVLGGTDSDDIVLWVDWREEDDAIVNNCAAILGLGGLYARFVEKGDAVLLEIARDGRVTMLDYGGDANRDATLLLLADVLRPHYDLRYCRQSDGSDTAAFLPLKREDWVTLEREYPDKVAILFATISAETPIFD